MGYMTRLVKELDGLESENTDFVVLKKDYDAAYQIGEKAAFSLHDITKEERERVENCKNNLLAALKKQKGWFEKWVLKYIERLY